MRCSVGYDKDVTSLQGRVQFPTGGKAHEPQGMIRCNSEADSTVWMKEDTERCNAFSYPLDEFIIRAFFLFTPW